jgi:hypothetical protein
MAELTALTKQIGGDHYRKLKIQPVEYIHANNLPFIEGCIVKYATRWRDKGGMADLQKIKHFVDLLIELETKHVSETGKPVHKVRASLSASGTALRKDGKSVLKRNT